MPRKRRESEIRDGEIAIRDRKPSVSRPRCFGWMASRLLAVTDSRSWELGRGPTGDRGGGVSNSRQAIRNHGRDRRQPSRLECSDGRWASFVGPKPPKGTYRWGPKILGARCGRATCTGPKPGLPHHFLESPAVSNMALTKSVRVRFFLSATSFD